MVRLLHMETVYQENTAHSAVAGGQPKAPKESVLDKQFLYVNFSPWDLRPSLERIAQKWLPVLRKTIRLNKILERFIKFTKKKNALGGAA